MTISHPSRSSRRAKFGPLLRPGSDTVLDRLLPGAPRPYRTAIVTNAAALAGALADEGFRIVSGGTDNHLMLVDLRPFGVTGKVAQEALDRAGITGALNEFLV